MHSGFSDMWFIFLGEPKIMNPVHEGNANVNVSIRWLVNEALISVAHGNFRIISGLRASQEISLLLRKPKTFYLLHKSPSL
jgi:hypothetical protein